MYINCSANILIFIEIRGMLLFIKISIKKNNYGSIELNDLLLSLLLQDGDIFDER